LAAIRAERLAAEHADRLDVERLAAELAAMAAVGAEHLDADQVENVAAELAAIDAQILAEIDEQLPILALEECQAHPDRYG
jgi:hypothetical protein